MSEEIRIFPWWHVGYQWFKFRHWIACQRRDFPWRVACWLPRSVALMAFVRVYSVLGECGPEYKAIYDEWERRSRP